MGMKWVLEAQQAGAVVIVVDPKFNRTAAHADLFVRIRPGTDIAFQGALIRYVIEHELYDEDYLRRATNALFKVRPDFGFEEGLFSGFDPDRGYDSSAWAYQVGADGEPILAAELEEPHTVFRTVKEHFWRYDLDTAAEITGVPSGQIRQVAETFATRRPGTILYALGATQHSSGVQQIRCYAILQLLLGNMGKPGGGIGANRGESNVQGATDMGLAWNYLPGYLPPPILAEETLAQYTDRAGALNQTRLVSQLKAWFGNAAAEENRFGFTWLPRLQPGKNHSLYYMQDAMRRGEVKFLMVLGENPAVSNAHTSLLLKSLASLEMLVCVDLFETETAAFWKAYDLDPQGVDTEVYLLPAASFLEKPGSLTNSGRWVQAREQCLAPPGQARNDLTILDDLWKRIRKLVAEEDDPHPEPIVRAQWDYGSPPEYDRVWWEINGVAERDLDLGDRIVRAGDPMPSGRYLRADGSTSAGNWLYTGIVEKRSGALHLQSRNRDLADPSGLGLHPGFAWSWPDNTRILYNRGSCDSDGRPLDSQRPLVWWESRASEWRGYTTPDVPDPQCGPETPEGQVVFHRLAEERGRLFLAPYARRRAGVRQKASAVLKDGPLPEHYEPVEGLVGNLLHPEVSSNPLAAYRRTDQHPPAGTPEDFPVVLVTGFLHEMWGGGAMSRRISRLIEAHPEPFLELSETLAEQVAVKNGQWLRVTTARGEVRLKAVVTPRMKPLRAGGRLIEVVWAPMHYGPLGDATGASINRLTIDALEPNVGIQETKACLCRVEKEESHGDRKA